MLRIVIFLHLLHPLLAEQKQRTQYLRRLQTSTTTTTTTPATTTPQATTTTPVATTTTQAATTTATTTSADTTLFYEKDGKCVRNCDPAEGPECGGINNLSWVTKYKDVQLCCQNKLSWVCDVPHIPCAECTDADISPWATTSTTTTPAATTGPDTTLFYNLSNKCVRNCDPTEGPDCGGIIDPLAPGQLTYPDVQQCCLMQLWWVCPTASIPCELCTDADVSPWATSTTTTTSTTSTSTTTTTTPAVTTTPAITTTTTPSPESFWVDWTLGKCVANCIGEAPCGTRYAIPGEDSIFPNVQSCCEQKLAYKCPETDGKVPCAACTDADLSAYPTTTTTTTTPAPDETKFYKKGEVCAQNCDAANGPPCGGINTESWVDEFADADTCCAQKAWWHCEDRTKACSDCLFAG